MADPKAPTWTAIAPPFGPGEAIRFGNLSVEVTREFSHDAPDILISAERSYLCNAGTDAKRVAIDAVRAMLREAAEALEAYEMAEKEAEQ